MAGDAIRRGLADTLRASMTQTRTLRAPLPLANFGCSFILAMCLLLAPGFPLASVATWWNAEVALRSECVR